VKVKVKFFMLREITRKRAEEVEVEEGATVHQLLEVLAQKYGQEFRRRVWNEFGMPRSHIHFLLDGKNIRSLDGFKTRLKEGSTLAIIPPIGGG